MFAEKAFAGFRLKVSGLAPDAASYAGFSEKRNVWLALLISGAHGGARRCRGGGRSDRSAAAIDLARLRLRRDHRRVRRSACIRVGVVLASLLMSLLYIGGETAQIQMALPAAVTGLFQGMLLFYLLAARSVHPLPPAMGADQPAARWRAAVPGERESRMNVEHLIPILASTVGAATPLIYAALGELIVERSGVLNLGVEGMMLVGAIAAFAVGDADRQPDARLRRGHGGGHAAVAAVRVAHA